MKKILLVAGARPNFMKIAPLMKEFKKHTDKFEVFLVHTGQHYDFEMSEIFFQNLDIPKPDIHLNVGSASNASARLLSIPGTLLPMCSRGLIFGISMLRPSLTNARGKF